MNIDVPEPATVITRAGAADAAAIHALQRLAFRTEAERYDDWTIPPLVESLADTQRALAEQVVLKAVQGGEIVGSVRGRPDGGTCHVGRLMVHPALRRHGLGGRLLTALEETLPAVRRFRLFTGARSLDNIRLYERLGYCHEGTEAAAAGVALVYLGKEGSPTPAGGARDSTPPPIVR